MAKARPERIDPHWPEPPADGKYAVSELASDVQGALSPFGKVTFPLPVEDLGYHHPETEINR
ncbi:hypothetical protein [Saccharothrix algeriensis]|uniref:Uncharacterized protein n=1 Tax=Saccharothrix algeriensis TaxID=173560 RepID=A0A8T8I4H7_9PSEU|nr:hypothetical protein [Saccharothrix algeriensis]MBM7811711.1 hypothetical protein [Saccharothrix algeriensis]QTR05478.1 hypothetical protein J7S33_13240 [Saccharothrix algeriensis]